MLLNYITLVFAYQKKSALKSLHILQNRSLKAAHNLPSIFPKLALYKDISKSVLIIYGLYKMRLLLLLIR